MEESLYGDIRDCIQQAFMLCIGNKSFPLTVPSQSSPWFRHILSVSVEISRRVEGSLVFWCNPQKEKDKINSATKLIQFLTFFYWSCFFVIGSIPFWFYLFSVAGRNLIYFLIDYLLFSSVEKILFRKKFNSMQEINP